jgi:GT2 family glycosyltransferase
MQAIREGAGLAFPYDGTFLDARGDLRTTLLAPGGLVTLDPGSVLAGRVAPARQLRILNRDSVGGVVLFDRQAFVAAGGYCEGFVSWGFEDAEIADRFRTLGRPFRRVAGYPLIHLSHRRPFRPFGGWYAGARRNAALRARLSALPADALRALIAEDGLGLDGPGLARLRGR